MKIAILTREFLPETQWGGIGTFYADFARALSEAGHEVEVFTQALTNRASTEALGARVHLCRPRFYGVGPPRDGALGGMSERHLGAFAWALARAVGKEFRLRHAAAPFDVVESHEHLGIGASLGGLEVPHVVRFHTAYEVFVAQELEPWPASRLIRRLESRALGQARCRIAPSELIARVTQQHFPDVPETDYVVPLACRFPPVDLASTLREKEPIVAFTGRLVPRKQPLLAVRAFRAATSSHPMWKLEIAGSDALTQRGHSAWQECSEALGSAIDRTLYHGALASADVASLYRRASIALIPSTFESFGLAALEAMNFGCVPIVTSGTGLAEVVADAGITAHGESGFAEALERLVRDRELRNELASKAISRVRKIYDRDRLLTRNVGIFDDLISSS